MESNHRSPPCRRGTVPLGHGSFDLVTRPLISRHSEGAPARIRTRNAAFEARNDSVSPPGQTDQRKERESNPHTLAGPGLAQARAIPVPAPFLTTVDVVSDDWRANSPLAPQPSLLLEKRGVEPRRRVCKTQALTPAMRPRHNDLGGSRTHRSPALNRSCIPVPARGRLEQIADLGLEPSRQAYETRPSNLPVCSSSGEGRDLARSAIGSLASGDGGIRTHTVHVLSVATPAGWSTSPFERGVRNSECGVRSSETPPLRLPTPNFPQRPWRDLNPRPPP